MSLHTPYLSHTRNHFYRVHSAAFRALCAAYADIGAYKLGMGTDITVKGGVAQSQRKHRAYLDAQRAAGAFFRVHGGDWPILPLRELGVPAFVVEYREILTEAAAETAGYTKLGVYGMQLVMLAAYRADGAGDGAGVTAGAFLGFYGKRHYQPPPTAGTR